jgi:hypothetical protein
MKSGISSPVSTGKLLSERRRGIKRNSFTTELEKFPPGTLGTSRIKGGHEVASHFENDPVDGLSVWLEQVPKKGFTESSNLGIWINLLILLIRRHAQVTKRIHVKSVGWPFNCLMGMFRELGRRSSREKKCIKFWDKFLKKLIEESLPQLAGNRITERFFKSAGSEVADFTKLGVFLRENKDPWKTNYNFPLSLIRDLDVGALKILLLDGIQKRKIALQAMRRDLNDQRDEYRLAFAKHTPAQKGLRQLVLQLGDRELAKRIDDLYDGLIIPSHTSLLAELTASERERRSQKRRPNSKRRKLSADLNGDNI